MQREQAIIAILQANSLRLTRARREFVALLSTAPKPLSASQILESLVERGVAVNKTTVYRELERFRKLNLVQVIDFGDKKQYFEWSSEEHHHHFVCLECDKIEEVSLDERDLIREQKKLIEERGLSVFRHSLEFFGLCKFCN